MIPGPPPGMRPEEEALEFVRKHVDAGTDIATICSGIWVAAFAGVLDGREATLTVRTGALVDALEGQFPDVKWMDRRYGVDRSGPADLWTAGMLLVLCSCFFFRVLL